MAFRILLVGLVAGLGCDPPSGGQVTRWMCSARSWFESGAPEACDVATTTIPAVKKVEVSSVPMLAVEPGPTYIPIFASEPVPAAPIAVVETIAAETVAAIDPTPVPLVIADEGFAAIVSQMIAGYPVRDEAPEAATTLLVDQVAQPREPAAWVEMPATEVKAEVQVAAVPAVQPSEWVGMPPIEPAPAPVAIAAPEGPRGERLGSAVRLTGQALQAWMSLLVQ